MIKSVIQCIFSITVALFLMIANVEAFSQQEINAHTVILMHFDNSTIIDDCGNK